MAIDTNLKLAPLETLHLDPRNPRLGDRFLDEKYDEEAVLAEMTEWNLDELATSFLENGFFVQEPLIAVEEKLGRENRLFVVEGNRRLAALKLLHRASEGHPSTKKWSEMLKGATKDSLSKLWAVPYLLAGNRDDVIPYLGFRHVTGIREWEPGQKAGFIAHMVDQKGMNFEEVRKTIGSKTPTVKQHYLAYKIGRQLEDQDDFDSTRISNRFSVLYLSLRTQGVSNYLNVDFREVKEKTTNPVSKARSPNLVRFAQWLFGYDGTPPLITDSRLVDKFGEILETPAAVDYLERTEGPAFETAYRYVRGTPAGIVRLLSQASDSLEDAIGVIHFHLDNPDVREAVKRLYQDTMQIVERFPEIERKPAS